jgi:predicted RNA binding protein YcfA (HicA-like mRNA interferase family)
VGRGMRPAAWSRADEQLLGLVDDTQHAAGGGGEQARDQTSQSGSAASGGASPARISDGVSRPAGPTAATNPAADCSAVAIPLAESRRGHRRRPSRNWANAYTSAEAGTCALRLVPIKFSEIIRLLGSGGWTLKRTTGSHRHDTHPTKPGLGTVAGKPNATLKQKTEASILTQARPRKERQ